jgi:Amt family ammonium transporter
MPRFIVVATIALAICSAISGDAVAKACKDPATGKFIKCPAAAAAPAATAPAATAPAASSAGAPAAASVKTPAAKPGGAMHCAKGKPCGNACIAMNKVCHKP